MSKKISVWILGSQLMPDHPLLNAALDETEKEAITVLFIESAARLGKRPYQAKKLVLLLSAMRHYAGQLRQDGFNVDYRQAQSFSAGLQQHVQDTQPQQLMIMAAADYQGRRFQQDKLPSLLDLELTTHPNSHFLISQFNPYPDPQQDKGYVMEYFYRKMRRHFDILMDGGDPSGGQWNFDKENRQPWPEDEQSPDPRPFEPDRITQEVQQQVNQMEGLVGSVEGFNLAVDRQGALDAFHDFVENRLPKFGPYEDAMVSQESILYHSHLAAYMNLGLLQPMELLQHVEEAYRAGRAPINSAEGFIRQVLGWREFMYWQYWRLMPGLLQENFWDGQRPLPSFFWDAQTDLNCLQHVLQRAIASGYNHHIERLMVLSNFSLLAGLQPQEVNEWFLSLYIDAYDWVMAPNVLGMGLHADGGLIATKPYIASANYINKMSDFCPPCRYKRSKRVGQDACPFNTLYWNFLIENEQTLRSNPRMGPNVLGLRHLDQEQRQQVQEQAQQFLDDLDKTADNDALTAAAGN